jgi:membrane associated rhomboid family serine protease
MVLSAFSHFNLWHIAANMYVLWSFTQVSLNLFGKEQWLAVYLSSGECMFKLEETHILPPLRTVCGSSLIRFACGAKLLGAGNSHVLL